MARIMRDMSGYTPSEFARMAATADEAVLREAEFAPSAPAAGWVPVSERLPDSKAPVLMVAIQAGPRGNYTTDRYAGWRDEKGWSRWPHSFHPTHWMPLPPAPTASNEGEGK
jgi:hypothetical protein